MVKDARRSRACVSQIKDGLGPFRRSLQWHVRVITTALCCLFDNIQAARKLAAQECMLSPFGRVSGDEAGGRSQAAIVGIMQSRASHRGERRKSLMTQRTDAHGL